MDTRRPRLRLNRERLTELTPGEMIAVIGGQPVQPTPPYSVDRVCRLIRDPKTVLQTLSCTCNPV
jgi:hypothetical protein